MGRGCILVEGHGEKDAAPVLVKRLAKELGLPARSWDAIRFKQIRTVGDAEQASAVLRRQADCDCALVLQDEDDGCPAESGPRIAGWLRTAQLPFPCAVVLAHREYEVFFLPCLPLMAGQPLRDERNVERPGLVEGAQFVGDPESLRGVKEWLSRQFGECRSYKPTLDQVVLTRMIDFPTLRESGLPCFATLENALRFLASGEPGAVYPPSAATQESQPQAGHSARPRRGRKR